MAATIKIKNSSTTGAVPSASDLVQGELAVNVTDTGLYTENASGTVVKLNAPSIDDKNTGATKHVTINTSGNVGVGAVTPSTWKLDVKSAGTGTVTNGIRFNRSNLTTQYGVLNFESGQFNNVVVNTAGTGCYWGVLYSTDGSTTTQPLTLDASGNLGVGTTSPNYASGFTNLVVSNAGNGGIIYVDRTSGAKGYFYANSTTSVILGSASNHPLVFGTNDSEKARIDTSGNLLAGCTTTLNLTQSGNYLGNGTASYLGTGHASGTSSGANYTAYYYNASYIGGITQNGTTAVAYNTTSDYRLKENVQPLSGALARVAALKPCTYTWKAAPDEIGEGFIAHELAEVCPQAVTGEKDAVNEDGSIKPQSIDTSFLVATLTAAIQELKAEFDAYKATHP